jgi:hypothetical protein
MGIQNLFGGAVPCSEWSQVTNSFYGALDPPIGGLFGFSPLQRGRALAATAFASACENRGLMQEGVVDPLNEEIRDVGARDEPPCPAARIDQQIVRSSARRRRHAHPGLPFQPG